MWKYTYTEELYHHGIPGQKWGIRRYQNKDGSLTAAGRKRAAKLEEKYQKLTGKKIPKRSNTKSGKANNQNKDEQKKKTLTLEDMSTEQLKSVTARMKAENDFINTMHESTKARASLKQKHVSKGKKFVGKIWTNIVEPPATDVARQLVKSYMVKFTNETLELDKEHKVYTNNEKKK